MTTETEKLPATGPYVDRLCAIWAQKNHEDTSALVLLDYAREALARDRETAEALRCRLNTALAYGEQCDKDIRALLDERDRAAQGEAVAWYVFADTEHWVTLDRDEADENRDEGCQVRPLIFGDTHPPVADTPCRHKFRHDTGIEPYCVHCGIKEVDDLLSGDAKVTP